MELAGEFVSPEKQGREEEGVGLLALAEVDSLSKIKSADHCIHMHIYLIMHDMSMHYSKYKEK